MCMLVTLAVLSVLALIQLNLPHRGQIHLTQLCGFILCARRLRGTYHSNLSQCLRLTLAGLTGECRVIKGNILEPIMLFT